MNMHIIDNIGLRRNSHLRTKEIHMVQFMGVIFCPKRRINWAIGKTKNLFTLEVHVL
jgi:hypothetical protein